MTVAIPAGSLIIASCVDEASVPLPVDELLEATANASEDAGSIEAARRVSITLSSARTGADASTHTGPEHEISEVCQEDARASARTPPSFDSFLSAEPTGIFQRSPLARACGRGRWYWSCSSDAARQAGRAARRERRLRVLRPRTAQWRSFGCSLVGCSLVGCSLVGCSLLGCSLVGCSLVGCSLLGRSLLGCSFGRSFPCAHRGG